VAGGAGLFVEHYGYDAGAHSIRRGERWAIWTSLATLMILLGTRMVSDPRCLVVLDPHQHGCHTFNDRGVPRRDRAAARPL